MKKLPLFLSAFLLIVALLLTGCGLDKNAVTGSTSDSVSKVSSNIEETKSNVNSVESDVPKTTEKALSQENTTKVVAASMTTIEANPSSQTPAIQVPTPIKPENTDKKAVTIAINCATSVAKGLDKQEKFKDIVPANGVVLPATSVEFKEGETVFDALKLVVRENKIQMQYEGAKGTPYIKGINNLYEFDGGPLSGWMYSVNKVNASYGCNETKLKNGDVIEWNYTCDMGRDLGQ